MQPREIGTRKGEVAEPVISGQRQQTVPRTGGAQDTSGVWKAARSEGLEGNWRDPTPRPTSGEGGAYKPEVVKGRRAGRESEGPTVPRMTRTRTAAEGKVPALVVPTDGGKREGMVQPTMTMDLAGASPAGALSEGVVAKTDVVAG